MQLLKIILLVLSYTPIVVFLVVLCNNDVFVSLPINLVDNKKLLRFTGYAFLTNGFLVLFSTVIALQIPSQV